MIVVGKDFGWCDQAQQYIRDPWLAASESEQSLSSLSDRCHTVHNRATSSSFSFCRSLPNSANTKTTLRIVTAARLTAEDLVRRRRVLAYTTVYTLVSRGALVLMRSSSERSLTSFINRKISIDGDVS